jgi:transmembrane sensor
VPSVVPFPDRKRIAEEAAAWLIRLDRGDLSELERVELRNWINVSPVNRSTIIAQVRLWDEMQRLATLAELFPWEEEQADSVTENSSGPAASAPAETRLSRRRFGHSVRFAAPAVLFCACLVASIAVVRYEYLPAAWIFWKQNDVVYVTRTGEQLKVTLEDGSEVALNTRSEIRVRFSEKERKIQLKRGEAFFRVAHNPASPFVVAASKGDVRALGTAFNVRLQGNEVEVLVAEGLVRVATRRQSKDDTLSVPSLLLRAGRSVTYDSVLAAPTNVERAQLRQRLAWTEGKWAFNGQTLNQVVVELRRHSDKRIEIADPETANLRIGGYFDIGDVEQFLRALESGFGVQHQHVSPQLILLSSPEKPQECRDAACEAVGTR